jgi:2-dehydro-3-deoxy-L-rhamnonate dehydrogenase (NAD+)
VKHTRLIVRLFGRGSGRGGGSRSGAGATGVRCGSHGALAGENMTVSYDFSGRAAVVTGASKGIGRRVAERLRDGGARVWAWDMSPAQDEGISSVRVDGRNGPEIAAALQQVLSQSGRVDILVNSAGYLGGYRPFEDYDRADWQQIVSTNLLGVLEVCSQVLPHMKRIGEGRIVNMGSLAGKEGLANMPVYSAASAGVIAFSKALGRELATTNIRVNCVTPGPIDTDLILDLGQEVLGRLITISPMRRLGTVDEVAEMVLWLCSEACSFSTGAVFDVSGGRATY